MCPFLKTLFGGGNSELEELMRQQTANAKRATDVAVGAAADAKRRAEAALVSPADSEPARKAAETRMRRMLGLQAPGIGALGAPPIGYRMLTGA